MRLLSLESLVLLACLGDNCWELGDSMTNRFGSCGSKSLLGVLIVHRASLVECLHYKPCLLEDCLLGVWLPILGIGSEIPSHVVRCKCPE